MSRTLGATGVSDTDVLAAINSGNLVLAYMVRLELPSPTGTIRICTAPRAIPYDFSDGDGSQSYAPSALIQKIDGITENADFKPRKVRIIVPGNSSVFTAVTTTSYQFSNISIWLAVLNATTYAVVGTPTPLVTDLLASSAVIQSSKDSFVIDLATEGPEILGMRDSAELASNAAQQRRYSGDTGMSKVERLGALELTWGGGATPTRIAGANNPGDPHNPRRQN